MKGIDMRVIKNMLYVLLITILTGCNQLSNKHSCFDYENYSIAISQTEIVENEEHLQIYYIEIDNYSDSAMLKKINTELFNSVTSWISGKVLSTKPQLPIILTHSPNYICVLNQYLLDDDVISNAIYDYSTIDLATGKKVFLNDLIDVSIEFVKHLRENSNIVHGFSGHSEQYDGNEQNLHNLLKSMTNEELLSILLDCSKTQLQIIEESVFSIEESIGSLVNRNTFYIEDGKLVIVIERWDKQLTINTADLTMYLKVPPW